MPIRKIGIRHFSFLPCNRKSAIEIRQLPGGIAQLVERQLCKLEVRGSNPLASSLRLKRSEKQGCHAEAKRRRAFLDPLLSALQDYGLAGQHFSSMIFHDTALGSMKDFHYVYILVSEAIIKRITVV
jgi:hypothetical protein